jgi:hypothetical protein
MPETKRALTYPAIWLFWGILCWLLWHALTPFMDRLERGFIRAFARELPHSLSQGLVWGLKRCLIRGARSSLRGMVRVR